MRKVVEIDVSHREKLFERFEDKLETAYNLSRKVVSFQANKSEPVYRWFKYKEGFSSEIVKYFLNKYGPVSGKILDPFAGVGTTLFAAQELGWESYGIELLPVGIFVMQIRDALNKLDKHALKKIFPSLWKEVNQIKSPIIHIKHIPITKDAFSEETELLLNKYLTYCDTIPNKELKQLLRFAAFAVLEDISYTRKDGQYLRWDYRSKRNLRGKPFDTGKIFSLTEAVNQKLTEIIIDLHPSEINELFAHPTVDPIERQPVSIVDGSCLEELPKFESNFFDFIITSPPYCNRYDYTRTYALELVFLGCDTEQVRNLRQSMLSCTVENKEKVDYLHSLYEKLGKEEVFIQIMQVYNSSEAMNEVNSILENLNLLGKLNNDNVPRMVKNYFLELCFVTYEMARVTKSGGHCVMVNDNVRYGGEEVPVDLILSEFAENFGFQVEKIFVLPKGKGNSSQQMGNYGRTETRKCVYLWQKL